MALFSNHEDRTHSSVPLDQFNLNANLSLMAVSRLFSRNSKMDASPLVLMLHLASVIVMIGLVQLLHIEDLLN